MLEYIYPEEERRFFVDREHQLAVLALGRELLAQGTRKNLALIGSRRVGKTVILKEYLRRSQGDDEWLPLVAYVDVPRLAFTPEAFAVQYIGHLLYWMAGPDVGPVELFLDPTVQLTAVGELGVRSLSEFLLAFHRELQKEAPDQHTLVEMAFNWPEVWCRAVDRRIVVVLDGFPELVVLDNYPQIGDVLALFRAVLQTQSRVGYVVAGSMVSAMERIFFSAASPLFVHFELQTVGPFGREASDQLARKRLGLAGGRPPASVLAAIYEVTGGHPFYVYAVTMRLLELVMLHEKRLDERAVHEAFVLETVGTSGRIYNLCRYVLEDSLRRARGQTVPRAVVQVLAREEHGLTLTQIARRLKRASGAIRQVLNWLIEVDLVVQRADKTYAIRDPVLHVWAAQYFAGRELTGLPRRRVLEELVGWLMERHQRVSAELGRAIESQIREMLLQFAGQEVAGELFGRPGLVRLPTFRSADPYRSTDGQTEVDALAKDGERWAAEIKWRGKLAGVSELRRLERAARRLDAEPWFISRSGFTSQAERYAEQVGIMLSTGDDLEALARLVRR